MTKLKQLKCPYCGADCRGLAPYRGVDRVISEDGSPVMFTARHYECLACLESFDTIITMRKNLSMATMALQIQSKLAGKGENTEPVNLPPRCEEAYYKGYDMLRG